MFQALTTFETCETKFKSKFESKVPLSKCRSHYVSQVSSTDAAVSATRSTIIFSRVLSFFEIFTIFSIFSQFFRRKGSIRIKKQIRDVEISLLSNFEPGTTLGDRKNDVKTKRKKIKKKSRKFYVIFARFRTFSDAFRPVRMFSDAFRCVRICSGAFEKKKDRRIF